MTGQTFMEGEVTELTKYEKARILGSRALQISCGAPFLVKLTEEDLQKINYSPIEIAKMELEKGVIPITVKRPLPVLRKRKKITAGMDQLTL